MSATGPTSGNGQASGAAPSLPLFFKDVTVLDAGLHGALKLDRASGYGFARIANALPLGLSEVAIAAQYYPIVLTSGPNPMPVAILGYQAGENLFIDTEGAWLDDSYIPAYVRAFPFILIEPPGAGSIYLGIETTAPILGDQGEPLFTDGKPTAVVDTAMSFALAYRDDLKRATEFGKALNDAGLLVANEARLTFKSGGTARLDGFNVVDGAKLDALADETFLGWRKQGLLNPLYAILQSSTRWGQVINLANGRRVDGVTA
ncbi:MAG TPA: SapC family protein [Aliidongia sp.]|uniref:SapC family protein n=1 Tax=Aliidongia sp. TaxID=1914230 RepID=UPI002DDD341B|nr:SapC family protein [Aliidongia sp.]HEV2673917.1 SapC family protein [Aliidongia sp.]